MKRTMAALAAGVGMLALAGTANAVTVCTPDPQLPSPCIDNQLSVYTPQNTFPNDLDEQDIFLDDLNGVTTVTGNVGSQNGLPEVQFVTDVPVDSSNGNATFKPTENGGTIGSVIFSVPGYYFNDVIFSTNLASITEQGNTPFPLTITGKNGNQIIGSVSYLPGDLGNGENKLLALGVSGALMTELIITSFFNIPEDDSDETTVLRGMLDFKQVDVSGLTPVPIPPAALLFGTALAGVGFMSRRKKAANAA